MNGANELACDQPPFTGAAAPHAVVRVAETLN
jgi:hypothetical protein